MKVDGKEQLPDSLENAKFTSMAWTHDNKGLFYNVSSFFVNNYKLAIHWNGKKIFNWGNVVFQFTSFLTVFPS